MLDEILVDAAERAGARFCFGLAVVVATRDRTGGVNGPLLRGLSSVMSDQGEAISGFDQLPALTA